MTVPYGPQRCSCEDGRVIVAAAGWRDWHFHHVCWACDVPLVSGSLSYTCPNPGCGVIENAAVPAQDASMRHGDSRAHP